MSTGLGLLLVRESNDGAESKPLRDFLQAQKFGFVSFAGCRSIEEGKLPSVHKCAGQSAGSTLRALKHVKEMLEKYEPEGERPNEIQVALDDLEIMIRCVE